MKPLLLLLAILAPLWVFSQNVVPNAPAVKAKDAMLTQYKLLAYSSPEGLEIAVNDAMAGGWSLAGSVVFSRSGPADSPLAQYCQAMIRDGRNPLVAPK